jgi:hypothetical protein
MDLVPHRIALLAAIHATYSTQQNGGDIAVLPWLARAIYAVRDPTRLEPFAHVTDFRVNKQPTDTGCSLVDSIPVDSVREHVRETLAKLAEPGADHLMSFMAEVRALVGDKDEELGDCAPLVNLICIPWSCAQLTCRAGTTLASGSLCSPLFRLLQQTQLRWRPRSRHGTLILAVRLPGPFFFCSSGHHL